MTEQQQAFLNRYLQTLTEKQRAQIPHIQAEYFCADEANANLCACLIDAGRKRASCSLRAAYEQGIAPLPAVGQLTVVLNWQR